MRLKLFLVIFFALAITAGSISYLYDHFFKRERMRLIDINLEQSVTLLQNSDLTLSKSEFSNQGTKLIQDIIGDDRINMIIGIYSESGNLLYKNDNASVFDMPTKLRGSYKVWENIETKDYFVRYLTIKDQSQKRIIKVGMILNQSLIRWKTVNQRIFTLAGIVISVLTIISFFLTYVLFRPVQKLADQVNLMSEKIDKGEFQDLKSWFQILMSKTKGNDEFQKLISSLDRLAQNVTNSQILTQKWSALMAHELKTPMTILKNSVETLLTEKDKNTEAYQTVEHELERLENIIMDFLQWASLENDKSRPELHVVNIEKRSGYLSEVLKSAYPQVEFHFENSTTGERKIFCNPIHFDQVVNNLLTNAFKYGDNQVSFEIGDDFIAIRDKGMGIPDRVLENFGKPFNKFLQGSGVGHGLGLAWVNTIAKKYNWKIQFTNNSGTEVRIILTDFLET